MIVPIKQILLEGFLKNTFNNIANGESAVKYGKEAQEKDGRVAKASAYIGAPVGAAVGGLVDGMWDGGPDETTGNGAAIGGLVGFGAPLAYGLNNNHQLITKDRYNVAKGFTKDKINQVRTSKYNPFYKKPPEYNI